MKKQEQPPAHKCEECKFAKFVTDDFLDLHGQPIILHCINSPYGKVRSERACKKFIIR